MLLSLHCYFHLMWPEQNRRRNAEDIMAWMWQDCQHGKYLPILDVFLIDIFFLTDLYWSNLTLCHVCFIYHCSVLSSLSQSEQPSPASSSSSSGFAPTHHKRQGNLSASVTYVTADVMFIDFFCQSHGLCSCLVSVSDRIFICYPTCWLWDQP